MLAEKRVVPSLEHPPLSLALPSLNESAASAAFGSPRRKIAALAKDSHFFLGVAERLCPIPLHTVLARVRYAVVAFKLE